MKYYIRAIKKTFFTSGRDSRKEFWSFFVVHSLIGFFLVILDFIIAIIFHRETLFFLVGIYVLLTVITVFTSAIRRFHDINISWIWFVLLNLIPFIGFIINIILLLQK